MRPRYERNPPRCKAGFAFSETPLRRVRSLGLPGTDPLNIADYAISIRTDAIDSHVPTAALVGLFWASGAPYGKTGISTGGDSRF